MARPPKPKAEKCRTCGKSSEPQFYPAIPGLMPARWLVSAVCQLCEDAELRAEKEAQDAREQRERLRAAGMEDAYFQGVKFSGYRTDTPARERVARMVRPLYKRLSSHGVMGNLLMYGNAGSGKTHLAVSFAKEALRMRKRVLFCPVPEMMLKLRAASLSGKQLADIERMVDHDVLVLDDLGSEKATEFVAENLYLIVDKWYRRDKSGLIVTSNLTLQRMGEVYGDRFVSRVAGMCSSGGALVDFDGCPDGRIENMRLGETK